MLVLLCTVLLFFTPTRSAKDTNNIPMNTKYPYTISNGNLAPPHRGEYIEVLSRPIKTAYSEVFWTQQEPVPLPTSFVKQYQGKTVGFVGYEVDVIRMNKTSNKYSSVPCYEQYNHHFAVSLLGNQSKLAYVGRQTYLEDRDIMAHRHAPQWEARSLPDTDPNSIVPVMQMFVEGNGNEHRRTFKYMPKGYAQYLESPTSFSPNLMMINTNNPNTPNWGKRGGPLPKGGEMPGSTGSWISTGSAAPPNADYSGLLECPCTTRVKKLFTGHTPLNHGVCPTQNLIRTATECYAASSIVYNGQGFNILSNTTVNDKKEVQGCYVLATPKGYNVVYNTYNQTNTNITCGDPTGRPVHSTGSESITLGSAFFGPGSSVVHVDLDLDTKLGNVTVTMSGPSSVWFAVGFDAKAMKDAPYTIEITPTSIIERRLANHAAGTVLQNTALYMKSNTVTNGIRTVVLTRPLIGKSKEEYTFDPTVSSLDLIAAIGPSATFGYHGNTRGAGTIMLVEMGAPVCLCTSKVQGGSINGLPWTSDCYNPNLLEQKNPSCDIATYRGGMTCCHHKVRLLDEDQTLPDIVDEFYLKFRFYYEKEPIDVTSIHATKNVFFLFREVEFNHGEYDVPQCKTGTDPTECVHTLISSFQVKDTIKDCQGDRSSWSCAPSLNNSFPQSNAIDMIHISGHCHAPSCISMELINADTGQSICLVTPVYGTSDEAMDEKGYIVALPPCIWSNDEFDGLQSPPRLSLDTNLTAIKKSNSTYFHYGVMSHFQMRGAWA